MSSSSVGLAFSPTVGRRPRHRRDFGGSGLTFGFWDFVGLGDWGSNSGSLPRLGVMMPGFSCWDATSWTLSEEVDAGSRCMPRRSAWEGFGGKSGIAGTGLPTRVGETSSGELVSVMVLDISNGDSASAMAGTSSTESLGSGIPSDNGFDIATASSADFSHSTVAHRTTSLLVVSSTSSKCRIFS